MITKKKECKELNQHSTRRGMADPSSIILDDHFVLDPLKHTLTDLRMQTWILALTQPTTTE